MKLCPPSRRMLFLALLLVLLGTCRRGPSEPVPADLLARLQALPGAQVQEITPSYGYPRAFQIDLLQPVDHDNPAGPAFSQRMYLSHADETAPMVFAPSGYAVTERSGQEVAGILQANCLNVTHRFFENAKPVPLSWQYLTIKQAAADHHRIVSLFKSIYSGPWLSAGASKSGETVLFHRRFYPGDVQATVASVAPLVFGRKDTQFVAFVDELGGDECRARIHRYQQLLLEKRDSLLSRFVNWFPQNGYTFSLEPNLAFEYAVLEYHFAFWQYRVTDCASIPQEGATVDELFGHLEQVLWLRYFSDYYMSYFEPYYYQAMTELGYPAYITGHLEHLLDYATDPGGEFFAPKDVAMAFKPEVMPDILMWLQTEGNNIIYIYGGMDPWSARAIESPGGTNSIKIVQPGADHRVRIADLNEQQLVYAKLEEWLGIAIPAPGVSRIAVAGEDPIR